MINVRNKIVSNLYNQLQIPIVPNDGTTKRPAYPYIGYSITAMIADNSGGNESYEVAGDDVKTSISLQNKVSFSFTVYALSEVKSYETIKRVYDFFKHTGHGDLSNENISVVDIMTINNRTILEVDHYEFRYGCDAIVRYNDVIDRLDITIDDYRIDGDIIVPILPPWVLFEYADDEIETESLKGYNTGKLKE